MDRQGKHIFTLSGNRIYTLSALVLIALSLVVIFALQSAYYHRFYNANDLAAFERVLHGKEDVLSDVFDDIEKDIETSDPADVLRSRSPELFKLSEEDDISIFYFEGGRLSYWSDHTIRLRTRWLQRMTNPVYQTANGVYVARYRELKEGVIYGLIKVRTVYPYENRYLRNGYQDDFKLGAEVELFRQTSPGLSDVHDREGNYLFSLELSPNLKRNPAAVTISLILFFIVLLIFFLYLSLRIDSVTDNRSRTRWLAIGSILILLVSIVVMYYEVPRIVFESSLFKPDVFASLNIASLGHLWLLILLVMMIVLLFYWFFNRSNRLGPGLKKTFSVLIVMAASFWFSYLHHLGSSLVMDSTISFEVYRLASLGIHTFIGLVILIQAFLVFSLLTDKALQLYGGLKIPGDYLFLFVPGIIVQLFFIVSGLLDCKVEVLIFYILLSGSIVFVRKTSVKIRYSRFFVLLFFFALYLTTDLQRHTSEKLNAQKDIELAKLSVEHDVVAEMLFPDLSNELKNDSSLIQVLSYPIISDNKLAEYLERTYFSGYLSKYNLIIAVCRPEDSTEVNFSQHLWAPCYPFYDDIVTNEGILLENTDFYFLNNLNGRISYLGVIPYDTANNEITLFLELNSKVISEELGYPSLLLRENQEQNQQFSYAKFNNGELITSGGDYSYRRSVDFYTDSENTFENIRMDGYDHTIFNVDPVNTVIVSIPVVSFVDKLISFSYLFALIIAIFSLAYLLVSATHIKATVTWDFKNKIQYSVIGILFMSFLIICTGTIYFVIQQFRLKHEENLQDTMRSLYIELVHKVESKDNLRTWSSDTYVNLDELLRKFSNVFYTDINMYDADGILLATSRAEIFEQELLSLRMDRDAFEKLSEESYSAFIHTEKVGNMSYQSAYVPLLNSENKLLAYLNLPYFTEPEVLAQEVTNLVVAILNTYVILMLLILFLSVFLADRITQPLRFLQSRIAQLSLSKTNEKIIYQGKDEIAGLVLEYNHMVDELQKSAELLAQSERESAWREMAKQIAHEIKNPLTPMKLNVQHLQRTISEHRGNIEEQVDKVSKNLIEQIDILASIASEFSDFAKMPKARNSEINLPAKLQVVVDLFANSEGVHIRLRLNGIRRAIAIGDPEQFQRVIINLVKNGIQAVPESREKEIEIGLEHGPENTVIISVSDNGKGIPESIQDKLFQPNFTTKSSGMGMGLAIASNIIKSMGGNIWYSTRADEGTRFFLKLPVVDDSTADSN